jgi:hypothetical protein
MGILIDRLQPGAPLGVYYWPGMRIFFKLEIHEKYVAINDKNYILLSTMADEDDNRLIFTPFGDG